MIPMNQQEIDLMTMRILQLPIKDLHMYWYYYPTFLYYKSPIHSSFRLALMSHAVRYKFTSEMSLEIIEPDFNSIVLAIFGGILPSYFNLFCLKLLDLEQFF